jgi:hypothetical protein
VIQLISALTNQHEYLIRVNLPLRACTASRTMADVAALQQHGALERVI